MTPHPKKIHPHHAHDPKVRSEVITKAFIKATNLLDFKSAEISQLSGMSSAGWNRVINHKRTIPIDTKEAEFVLLFIRIYRSLDALFGGNNDRAKEWLRSYNHHLNGIPAELLQNTEGLVTVAAYLDAMRGLA